MFVVRIMRFDADPDYKAFERLDKARERFDAAWIRTHDGEFRSVAIFQVSGTINVREAIDAVMKGAQSVSLIELKEPINIEIKKNDLDIDI